MDNNSRHFACPLRHSLSVTGPCAGCVAHYECGITVLVSERHRILVHAVVISEIHRHERSFSHRYLTICQGDIGVDIRICELGDLPFLYREIIKASSRGLKDVREFRTGKRISQRLFCCRRMLCERHAVEVEPDPVKPSRGVVLHRLELDKHTGRRIAVLDIDHPVRPLSVLKFCRDIEGLGAVPFGIVVYDSALKNQIPSDDDSVLF